MSKSHLQYNELCEKKTSFFIRVAFLCLFIYVSESSSPRPVQPPVRKCPYTFEPYISYTLPAY